MKFRKSCDLCNVTFFTPNRNALYCAKCAKKMGVAEPTTSQAAAPAPGVKSARAAVAPAGRARAQVGEQAEAAAPKPRGPVLVKKAKKGPLSSPLARLSSEQRSEAAELYRQMVEAHERPAGGRRKSIAASLNVPLKEVILAVRDWARRQEAESPTPRLSRQQLFEIEKRYWEEIDRGRYPLDDFPARLAEDLGFANRWQVLRWIDVLHDDPHAFDNVPEPTPEARQQVIDAYRAYLDSETPPEKGLHQTIAERLEGAVKPRQVHKILQNYRHDRRESYSVKE